MKRAPYISIIMPVYNAEAYLDKSITSVLSQNFSDFELICVNDCSKDRSLEILRNFEKKDNRVKVIDSPVNVGAGEARNLGIDCSNGVYIAFIDSDDTIESDLYEKTAALTDNGEVDRVIWGAYEEHYNGKNEHVKTVPIIPQKNICKTKNELVYTALELEQQTLFGYLWNSLFKAEIVKKNAIKMRKSVFYEDYFFSLDFLKKSKNMVVFDYAGYHYFKRVNSSITNSFSKEYFDLSYERVEKFYDYCVETDTLSQRAVEILGSKLLRYTLSALARNNNPLSEMTGEDRKQWIKENLNRDLYNSLLCRNFKTNPIFKVLKFCIRNKCVNSMLTIGKLVYFLRG